MSNSTRESVNFELKVSIGEVKLLNLPPIYVGIQKGKPVWKERREPPSYIGGERVASKRLGEVFKSGYTTATSLQSVWDKTQLKKYFNRQLKRDYEIFASIWTDILSKEEVSRARLNTAAAILKKAYFAMAKMYTASINRSIIKGHNLFAIGTGQTLSEITAWVEDNKL